MLLNNVKAHVCLFVNSMKQILKLHVTALI